MRQGYLGIWAKTARSAVCSCALPGRGCSASSTGHANGQGATRLARLTRSGKGCVAVCLQFGAAPPLRSKAELAGLAAGQSAESMLRLRQ